MSLALSQAEVAQSAGVSRKTLMRFEAGENVAFEVAIRVAIALSAEDGFANLFPAVERRTIEDLLRANPRRQRAPRKRRSAS